MASGDNHIQMDTKTMNSILIIAHTPLASALRSAALHAFPDAASRVDVIDVLPAQAPSVTLAAARECLVTERNSGITGTLVMSDVFGATPCNVAQQLVDGAQVKCIAGASLPMLFRAITYWDESLEVMAEKALLGGSLGAIAVT
jgi:mannose PTS system EIIA component